MIFIGKPGIRYQELGRTRIFRVSGLAGLCVPGSGLTILGFQAQNPLGLEHKKTFLHTYGVSGLVGLVRELGPGFVGY